MPKTPRARTILSGLIVLVSLAAVALRGQPPGPEAAAAPAIRVDQAGYLPDATKIALVVTSDAAASTARIRRQDGGEVLQVPMSQVAQDEHTGDSIRAIDFTTLTEPGTYVISAAGLGESDPVHVRNDVYRRPLYLALRSFYGQRCGTDVDLGPSFPGYRYPACHLDDAPHHPSSGRSGTRPATKGWHDAGG